ncbi:MAG: acyl-CoA dehydrogenase family protein [Gammaproteobacteria bacterium]|nr:acyl-CoA dehydrogenase family protein [Gammaproteobacteria bacterium]
MDLSWTTEQTELREQILDFARKELTSDIVALDREGVFDRNSWDKCGDFGILGLPVPEKNGGLGKDSLTTAYALESLGYACRDNGLLFSMNAHMWTCSMPIAAFGTQAQKERFLPGLCSGKLIGGNAMSETGSGSDAYKLRTMARREGDRYIINGSKTWITNGPVADLVVVFANTDADRSPRGISAFIVETRSPGFSVTRHIEKMGLRTSPMAELYLNDCEVPEENRLGKEGAGTALFTHSMTWERGLILATAVGSMQRQLEDCVRYAGDRKQFGSRIRDFQLVAQRLVDMKLRLEAARALLYKVAWMKSRGKSAIMEAAMAKLCISENWIQSCQDAIQIHGANGYTTEYGLERELRDAIGSRIYSGTSEIQRLIVSSLM